MCVISNAVPEDKRLGVEQKTGLRHKTQMKSFWEANGRLPNEKEAGSRQEEKGRRVNAGSGRWSCDRVAVALHGSHDRENKRERNAYEFRPWRLHKNYPDSQPFLGRVGT